ERGFRLRGLVELKVQAEDFRRRVDGERGAVVPGAGWIGEVQPGTAGVAAIEAPNQPPPPNVVTIQPGTTMASVERMMIEAALKETRGNRRKAAEILGIGDRTLYR